MTSPDATAEELQAAHAELAAALTALSGAVQRLAKRAASLRFSPCQTLLALQRAASSVEHATRALNAAAASARIAAKARPENDA